MKIAVVVHGRFHAFDLAHALLRRGHDVTLFTNYPRWAAGRFGMPGECVRSFWLHGGIARVARRLQEKNILHYREAWFHRIFGYWASAQMAKEYWDVIHLWSGVAEEVLRRSHRSPTLKILMRGSAHIRAQARLLEEEENRTGAPQDRPSPWIIAREEREYELADLIVVLSTFAYDTFVAEGVPWEKLRLLPLGTSLDAFRPSSTVVEARCERIRAGEPLRVLYVGALSFQKGFWDLAAVLRVLAGDRFRFRVIGPVAREAKPLVATVGNLAEFVPKRPQRELPKRYRWGDLFVFPTIQDGYAVVLAQATAGGLPILTTPNSCGPDLIREGQTGWIVPIRSPRDFVERLRWCDAHREELAAMVRRIYQDYKPRDWSDVAADFEAICAASLSKADRKVLSDGS